MISTKGRYALRILLDLAKHPSGEYVPLKEIAERENISLKYMEHILPVLKNSGLILGIHGKGGGYRLSKSPIEYTVLEILEATEGSLAPVSYLAADDDPNEKLKEIALLPMWKEYYQMTKKYFSSITLQTLLEVEEPDNYII